MKKNVKGFFFCKYLDLVLFMHLKNLFALSPSLRLKETVHSWFLYQFGPDGLIEKLWMGFLEKMNIAHWITHWVIIFSENWVKLKAIRLKWAEVNVIKFRPLISPLFNCSITGLSLSYIIAELMVLLLLK